MIKQKCHQNVRIQWIVDRPRTISLSNDSHPTGAVKSVYEIPAFKLTAKVRVIKGIHI